MLVKNEQMIPVLPERRAQARIAAALVAALALSALWLHLHVGLMRHPDRAVLSELWRIGRYFTILTTALVALSFAWIAVAGLPRAGWSAGLVLWTAIVGAVYHALLARELTGLRWLADLGLHTVVPLAVLLWWLAYAHKTGLGRRHALLWLIWPALYVTYALIRGEMDGRHPYFFVDPARIGWSGVALWCAGLGLVFWLAGLALVLLGGSLGARSATASAEARTDDAGAPTG